MERSEVIGWKFFNGWASTTLLETKSWVASCATGKLLQSDVPEWRFFRIYEDQVGSFSTSFGWEKNLGSITCSFQLDIPTTS